MPPRWCICSGFEKVECPFQVNVLIHHREFWRPSSTGRLIERVVPSSRQAVYRYDIPLSPEAIGLDVQKPVWILHPLGEPLGERTAPPGLQVLLLDGAWREATRMMRAVEGWGQRINLPMTGESRYWLRGQHSDGNYSTVEALLFLLKTLGHQNAYEHLRLQFELHVYAGLRARGEKQPAEDFLRDSPLVAAFPAILEALERKRPRI
jgi:DTW domain-containing protein